MSGTTEQRRGYCPSVWTPMESGDGMLLRVRAGARTLHAGELRGLARLARSHGNGLLEITRRANLQLRGLSEASLTGAQEELLRRGLVEASPEREARLGVLVHPLAGLDDACAELDALARELSRLLAAADDLSGLPAKFGVVVDGGGRPLEVSADIRVDVRPADPFLAFLSAGGALLGAVLVDDAPRAVLALARAGHSLGPGRRMRDVVAEHGLAPLHDCLRELFVMAPVPPASPAPDSWLGHHVGRRSWFGLGIPFGAAEASQWEALATLAERYGSSQVRITPRRTVVLLDVAQSEVPALSDTARRQGMIVDPRDPLLNVVACAGAPACRSGCHETRAFALSLLRPLGARLAAGATLHVSGCKKGCALDGPADFTIVHGEDGPRLGLGTDVAGTLAAAPLTIVELKARLAELGRGEPS
jgi:precorrin-3B synthase